MHGVLRLKVFNQRGSLQSRAYHVQAVSAIKFLYDNVLRIPKTVGNLPRPKKEHKLPTVLSQEEVG